MRWECRRQQCLRQKWLCCARVCDCSPLPTTSSLPQTQPPPRDSLSAVCSGLRPRPEAVCAPETFRSPRRAHWHNSPSRCRNSRPCKPEQRPQPDSPCRTLSPMSPARRIRPAKQQPPARPRPKQPNQKPAPTRRQRSPTNSSLSSPFPQAKLSPKNCRCQMPRACRQGLSSPAFRCCRC